MTTIQADVVLHRIRHLVGTQDLTDSQLLERFTARRDAAAFEALVRRHGPLVFGVCRRVLHNWHDAEDAFQATFLVLARKTDAAGKRGSLVGWLHQVAYHVALRARARAARHRTAPPGALATGGSDPLAEITSRELLTVIDAELMQLPERYRTPLVLCYMEGKARDLAARQLGWSASTLQRRLEQGRERLRARLSRRGLSLPAALLTAGIAGNATSAAVPRVLVASTVKAGVFAATGRSTATVVSPTVVTLADGMFRATTALPMKAAATVLLIAALGVAAVGWAGSSPAQQPGQNEHAAVPKAARKPAEDDAERRVKTITGRVEDAAGRPVADAQVAVLAYRKLSANAVEDRNRTHVLGQTRTGVNGTFEAAVPGLSSARYYGVQILAGAPGQAIAWREIDPDAKQSAVTLRLEVEQVLRVRLVGLQGEPVVKANVRLSWVHRERPAIGEPADALILWPGPFITDENGRFTVRGLGPKHTLHLAVHDDRYARQQLVIEPEHKDRANEVTFPLLTPRVVTGRITCEDTGKPLAGARVLIMVPGENFYGKTAADGNYEVPVSDTRHVGLYVAPPDGAPYLTLKKHADWPKGKARTVFDLALPRGIVVRGKVAEEGAGKPVVGAKVEFLPQQDNNPNFREDVACLWHTGASSGSEGEFQMVLPPGPSHLLVTASTPDYIHQEIAYSMLVEGKANHGRYYSGLEGNAYYGGQRVYVHGLVPVNLKRDAAPEPVQVTFRRGATVKGRLLDADGKPVPRAVMASRLLVSEWEHIVRFTAPVFDGQFELRGCDPKAIYRVFFLDDAKQQGAVAEIAGKQAHGDPLTIRLAPCGTATARLLSRDGHPFAKRSLVCDLVVTPGPSGLTARDLHADLVGLVYLNSIHHQNYPVSDAQGRFTVRALIPGATYRFYQQNGFKDCIAEAGKTVDWGDIADPVLFAE